jgi:methionyl-tRNA synthetase
MRQVLVDLNKNLVILNGKFAEMVYMVYNKQVKKIIEKIISRSSTLFFDFIHAVEHLNLEKAASLLLEFLDEADAFMDDIAWRVALKPFDKLIHTIRELLQVVRTQVIFLDQFRQANFAF